MRFHYISPSTFPSRTANSVHVALQCEGLVRAGCDVTLYCKRSIPHELELPLSIKTAYGVDASAMKLVSFYSAYNTADNVRIAAMALKGISREDQPGAILSRNLYAAFVLAVLRKRPLLFETHQLEEGFRKTLQRTVITCPWVVTVAISGRLVECLREHHAISPANTLILHDAARDDIQAIPHAERRAVISGLASVPGEKWEAVCGYFGHMYPGRGIEIIEAMARARPACLFLLFGGNEQEIRDHRMANRQDNLLFAGHVPHPVAQEAMAAMDVLLMPYQTSVSIGSSRHDTARWMSPMKMFEYLAAGVPIISSDLPALREVLRHEENSLLVPPHDADAWVAALDRLVQDSSLARHIEACARRDYLNEHTWTKRAHRLLEAARAL